MSMQGSGLDGDGAAGARDGKGGDVVGLDGQYLDGHLPAGATPSAAPPAADPHGHAALLLVESLIHELVERALLPLEGALAVIDSATSVQREFVESDTPAEDPMRKALSLLNAIGFSLRGDLVE